MRKKQKKDTKQIQNTFEVAYKHNSENIIELCGVGYSYGKDTVFYKKAVDDLTLSIRRSSITGIIGHTGSGKSTLVQMMCGLLRPDEGKIYLDGEDIFLDKKRLQSVRFRVGLVFQYPEYQLFDETVARDIAFGPKNQGLSEEEIDQRVKEAAAFVRLEPELMEKSPFELSGGQKRRAAIAGVIAMRPEVLILDEPASGLDPIGRETVFSGLLEYREKTGATVIIVSHSMEDMARYSDDIIVMNGGKLAMAGSKSEIFSRSDTLCSMGLDIPQVSSIMLELRRRGYPISQGIFTVEDAEHEILRLLSKGGHEHA